MTTIKIDDSLRFLQSLVDLNAPNIDQIKNLKLILNTLRLFLSCDGKYRTRNNNLEVSLTYIQTVVQNSVLQLQVQRFGRYFDQIARKTDPNLCYFLVPYVLERTSMILDVLARIKILEPDIREVYGILSRSSRPITQTRDANIAYWVDSLMKDLKDALSTKNDLIVVMKDEIEALEEKLRVLRNFLWFKEKRCIRHEEFDDISTHYEAVVDSVTCFLYLCLINNTKEFKTHSRPASDKLANIWNTFCVTVNYSHERKSQVFDMLRKIKLYHTKVKEAHLEYLKFIKSLESDSLLKLTGPKDVGVCFRTLLDNLIDLSTSEVSFMVPFNDQIKALYTELRFLGGFIENVPLVPEDTQKDQKLNEISTKLGAIIREAHYFFYIFSYEMNKIGNAMDLIIYVYYFLEKIKLFKEDARETYQQIFPAPVPSRLKYPRTNELGFIDFFIEKLQDLLNGTYSIASFKDQFEIVRIDLMALQEDFKKKLEHHDEEEIKHLITELKDVAHKTETLIDSYLLLQGGSLDNSMVAYYTFGWLGARENIKLIRRRLGELKVGIENEEIASSVSNSNKKDKEMENKDDPSLDFVGFTDEKEKITDALTRGSMELQILSVVGMPGLGKTTLANSVYRDHWITLSFHKCAWCCVSQEYNKRRLFLKLLHQVSMETDRTDEMTDDVLAERLYKSLKGQRYLIVLDDIWDVGAWNDLKECFPNDSNRSRIMFTTRISDVALQAKSNAIIHNLRQFSDEESWELLQVKLFHGKDYPPALREVGMKIAANCGGLPLAVVLASGLLKNRESKEECWRTVLKSLMSLVADDPKGQGMSILELSYKHLPDYLKPCFLFLGAFQEDAEISVSKLIRVWIADGLIRKRNTKLDTLEDEAKDHLQDLIGRNLVIISGKKSNGGVKSCKIHDLLREFCLAKVNEENFMQLVNVYDNLPTSDCILSVHYRLCICFKGSNLNLSRYSGPNARCLLLFDSRHIRDKAIHEGFFESFQFSLLRILDFGNIIFNSFPNMNSLVLLRYLSVQIASTEISCQIRNLWHLETLSVRNVKAGVALLSTEDFTDMSRLRHLHIDKLILWRSFHHFQLVNLQTISGMYVSCVYESEEILKRCPSLRKLSCIFRGSWNRAAANESFPYLSFLTQLESLKVIYEGKVPYPYRLNFPSQLRNLTLSNFRQPWKEISAIVELPNLEVLKLQNEAFVGREWDMKEKVFLKLKYLKLESMKLVKWIASEENFPFLETVVLVKCRLLEVVPSSIGDIPTLQMIDMKWCSQTANDSVWEIKKEQEEQGNEQLKVSILNG